MATWTTRERIFRTKEWIVPAAEPWGATHDQVMQAINLARSEVIRSGERVDISDAEVRVHARDDEIIIVIVLEDRTVS